MIETTKYNTQSIDETKRTSIKLAKSFNHEGILGFIKTIITEQT